MPLSARIQPLATDIQLGQDLTGADALLVSGRPASAEAAYRQLLAANPGHFELLLRLGIALEHQGRADAAIDAYEAAISVNPGHALPFTRRAVLAFRRAFGPPPSPAARKFAVPRLGMSTLGANGRFGNQLLQYGFLRMYAAEYGLTLETPDWIGRDLFDLDDPLPGTPLPVVSEEQADLAASLNRDVSQVYANADLWGYCCYPTGRLRRHQARYRSLFRPGQRLSPLVAPVAERLRARGNSLIGIHLRRGDFGYGQFWIAPAAWYATWLDAIWPRLDRPVLYVASDDPSSAAELKRFAPMTAADFEVEIPGAEFYLDFHVLRAADQLAISNSSFSFVAAMLNECARSFMRPDRLRAELVPFDPWDSPVLIQ